MQIFNVRSKATNSQLSVHHDTKKFNKNNEMSQLQQKLLGESIKSARFVSTSTGLVEQIRFQPGVMEERRIDGR